eukprot:jgi/Botrbrau1/1437/Bobra.0063s0128.1
MFASVPVDARSCGTPPTISMLAHSRLLTSVRIHDAITPSNPYVNFGNIPCKPDWTFSPDFRACTFSSGAPGAPLRRQMKYKARAPAVAADVEPVADLDVRLDIKTLNSQEGRYTVVGSLTTDVEEERVWSILTDYINMPSLFSSVDNITILVQDASVVLHQECRWQFWVFSGTFRLALRVHEEPEHRRISFQMVESPFMRQFRGAWQLRGRGEGWGGKLMVEHELSLEPRLKPRGSWGTTPIKCSPPRWPLCCGTWIKPCSPSDVAVPPFSPPPSFSLCCSSPFFLGSGNDHRSGH